MTLFRRFVGDRRRGGGDSEITSTSESSEDEDSTTRRCGGGLLRRRTGEGAGASSSLSDSKFTFVTALVCFASGFRLRGFISCFTRLVGTAGLVVLFSTLICFPSSSKTIISTLTTGDIGLSETCARRGVDDLPATTFGFGFLGPAFVTRDVLGPAEVADGTFAETELSGFLPERDLPIFFALATFSSLATLESL